MLLNFTEEIESLSWKFKTLIDDIEFKQNNRAKTFKVTVLNMINSTTKLILFSYVYYGLYILYVFT